MTDADLERFIDGLGLRYFKGKEFTPYWKRTRNGVSNSRPHESLWPNIVKTIIVLDHVRKDLGKAITLTSTYRSTAYNKAVGGASQSYHTRFTAIDFQSIESPLICRTVCHRMRGKTFKFPNGNTFVFRGGLGLYSTFVHIDSRGYDANW